MTDEEALKALKKHFEVMEVTLSLRAAREKEYAYPSELEAIEMAISALRERIERNKTDIGIPTTGGWISVKDRLPEINTLVLLIHNYHSRIGDFSEYEPVTVGYLHQPCDKRRKPYFYYVGVSDYGDMVRASSMCPGSENVTHWMPLPEPPRKEDEA